MDELAECTLNIGDLRQFLTEKEEEYYGLISVKMDSAKRLSAILQIGDGVHSEFTTKQSAIGVATESVKKRMTRNNATDFVMEFVNDEVNYNRIIKDIGRFGTVQNGDDAKGTFLGLE